jgi:GAF domain-containing protein
LLNELRESLQQQAATAKVLKVISRLTFNIQGVLNTLVESAARLCQAENVQIFLRDGDVYRLTAYNGFSPEYQEYAKQHPIAPGRGTLVARTALEVAPVHIPDILADLEYTWHEGQRLAGFRAALGIPLLREGICVGVMAMTRAEPRPFTGRQIELVTTFADQAVIAIENARLFDEVQARTKETQESLEYQMAISEVLNVISRSPNTLQPVLDTIVRIAARLCAADFAVFFRLQDGRCHIGATNAEADFIKVARENPIIPTRASCTGRAVLERRTVHVLDASTDPEYAMPDYQPVAKNRTMLGVPLLRDGVPLGTITLWKTRVAQKRQLGESLSGLDLLALGNQDLADLIAVGVEVYDRLGARHNVTGDADRRGEAVAAGLHHEDRCAGRRLRIRRCACRRDGQWAKGKCRQREVHRSMSRVAHRGRGRGLLIRDVDDLHAAVLAAEGMLDILELGLAVADGH